MCRRPEYEEEGATLVLVALVISVVFIAAAMVIDLSIVRQNRQDDKSATDFAAAAGIRGLNDGSGRVNIWEGICAARDFLLANNTELSPLTAVDSAGSPITDPCSAPPTEYCDDPSDSKTFLGLADNGRLRVRIHNGYNLSPTSVSSLPGSSFSEDANEYVGDEGVNPCEHLAVIIEESEEATFGGIAGRSSYRTVIRSVARLEIGDRGLSTAALVLLEQTTCKAIEIEGGSNASVTIDGVGSSPGIIHSDSDGSACLDDYIFSVGVNSVTSPKIIAGSAKGPNTAGVWEPGLLTAYALRPDVEGANPGSTYDAATTPRKVCAERDPIAYPTDCTATDPVTGGLPSDNDRVTRTPADDRYLNAANVLLESIDEWTDANRPANTTVPTDADYWRMIEDCNNPPATPVSDVRVFVNCKGGQWKGKGFIFTDSVREIVVDGYLVLEGGDLVMGSPDTVYIGGATGQPGIRTAGSGARLSINTGELTPTIDCDTRQSYLFDNGLLTTDRTKVVVGTGGLQTEGNLGQIRMCATSLFFVDNTHVSPTHGAPDGPCPIGESMPSAPYANGCKGNITVKGTASVDWSAPNVTEGDPSPYFDDFEDLAFWTETHIGNTIEGSGLVELAGIFYTPNADPFRVAGEKDDSGVSKFDLRDSQFWTRKLQVAGGGDLVLAPQPKNAIQIPVLGGFTLVR